MKKILFGLGIFLVLLVGAVIALPFLIPPSTYRQVVETQLETALGRDVTFAKDPKVQIFPQLGVKIEGVTIANAEGFAAPHFAKADSMDVAVKWGPLLSRRVEIASANFIGAEVLLEEKKNGDTNWVFEPTSESNAKKEDAKTSKGSDPGFDALIPKASLKKSRIQFVSAASDLKYDITDINLDASLSGLDGPVTLKGALSVNQEPFNIDAKLTSLANVMKSEPFRIEADIKSAVANASYQGSVVTGDTVTLDGTFAAQLDNLSKTMTFANVKMEQNLDEIGFVTAKGKLSGATDNLSVTDITISQKGQNLASDFTGAVRIQGSKIQPTGNLSARSSNTKALAKGFGTELEGVTTSAYDSFETALSIKPAGNGFTVDIQTLRFDAIKVTGSANVDISPKTPRISANLRIPDLDLSPYLLETEKTAKNSQAQQSLSWSEEPIDLSALKSANGDFELVIGRIANQRAEVLDVNLNARLNNGALTGSLVSSAPETARQVSKGRLNPLSNGDLTTNFQLKSVSEKMNNLSFSAKGSGIAAADLVKFFTGQNVLKGVASIDATANTSGASISDFVKNLNGTYAADVADGAIMGINLAQLLRSAKTALTTGKLPSALSPEEQTDFSSLKLQGDIQSGKANIQLFQLLSPFVRADATGSIDLFNQTLDLRINPQTVTTEKDGSTENGIGGYGIPLRVKGRWDKISGSLDMDYLSKLATKQATDKVKSELDKKLGGDVNNILNKITGGKDTTKTDSEDKDETEEKKEKTDAEKAKDLLNDLFGKKK